VRDEYCGNWICPAHTLLTGEDDHRENSSIAIPKSYMRSACRGLSPSHVYWAYAWSSFLLSLRSWSARAALARVGRA
jgi:hypothetical protein